MEAAWSITDLPPAAPGILLLLLLVDIGLLVSLRPPGFMETAYD